MNKIESETYIKKFDKNINIWEASKIYDYDWIASALTPINEIAINESKYYEYDSTTQKAILLHEYGHIKLGHWDKVKIGLTTENCEYDAHMFAIKIASEKSVKEKLISLIVSWGKYKKDFKHMAYVNAYRKYLKNIQKRI